MVKNDSALVKYSEIWNKITELIGKNLHSQPLYDEKCIKTKVETFNECVSYKILQQKDSKGKYTLCLFGDDKITLDSITYEDG